MPLARTKAAPKRQTDESVEIVRPRYLAIPREPGWAQVSRSVKVEALTDTATVTLPLGSDHARLAGLKLPKDEARRQLGIPADRTLVLFVGRLLPLKGVRELVDALLTLESRFLGVLLGEGPRSPGIARTRTLQVPWTRRMRTSAAEKTSPIRLIKVHPATERSPPRSRPSIHMATSTTATPTSTRGSVPEIARARTSDAARAALSGFR